jgi:hypothetical protein
MEHFFDNPILRNLRIISALYQTANLYIYPPRQRGSGFSRIFSSLPSPKPIARLENVAHDPHGDDSNNSNKLAGPK